MTFRLEPHATTIAAAPGESVLGRVTIHNDGSAPATYTVTVVGLDSVGRIDPLIRPPVRVSVEPGASASVDVPIPVPATLGIGEHAAAFEATSNRPTDRAVLIPFTLSIASVERVDLVPVPSTIRGRRRVSFHLDVTNHEPHAVELALTGEAPDVEVEFSPPATTLQPGQRLVARGKVRGPKHWSGEPTQHNLLITAIGRASSTTITTPYVQRPLFAHRLRMVLAAVTVVALWLGAIGGVAFWLATRDDGSSAGSAAQITAVDTDGDGIVDAFFDADGNRLTAVDTDGDGIPDAFYDADGNLVPGTDTDGDGIPDTLVGSDGQPIKAIDTDGDGIPDALSDGSVIPEDEVAAPAEPKTTIVRGTVSVDGDPSAVAVTLTPVALGAAPTPEATPIGFRGTDPRQPTGKLWSARHGVVPGISSTVRRTVSIAPQSPIRPEVDGVFLFSDVLQGQSYEISFALAGYDTQSFVITPAADGEPIDLDVELQPASGALAGSVVGPGGSKNAAITVTDGTLEFRTTADSNTGAWSIDGVSTPGVYTITAELRGYATAVRQIELRPGQEVSDIALQMVAGLGTITGRIVNQSGEPLGGVTVAATNGETTLTSTSLTQGDVGFFSLPQLDLPATYTVSATLDGYLTETRRVPMEGSVSGISFTMISETATLTGRVTNAAGAGIPNAGLVVSTGDLTFRASTSAAPNAGVFSIDRLPPGTYTITVEHYQYESATEFVTLQAGITPPPLNVVLQPTSGPPSVGTGSLVVDVVNDDPTISPPGINGATVTISRNRSGEPPRTLTDPDASTVRFDKLPVGTYTIRVTAPGYNASQPITRSVGLSEQRVEVELQKLGSASGMLIDGTTGIDAESGQALTGYSVVLHRLNADLSLGQQYGPYAANPADGTWTTPPSALTTGLYDVRVIDVPAGYLVRSQILDTSPQVNGRPMTFLVPAIVNAKVNTIDLPPIRADRFPQITGRVYAPRLNGTAVEFDPVDDGTLAVTATCNGSPIADVTLTNTGGSGEVDTFVISKEQIAAVATAAELPTTCTIDVGADGRVPTPIAVAGLDAGNGNVLGDRLVATALAVDPDPLFGTLFWLDEGSDPAQRVPIAGTVTTGAPAITRFTPTEATAAVPDPRPGWDTATLQAVTNPATGAWALDGQLFGVTPYNFTAPNFGTGVVPVRIDQTGRAVPASTPSGAVVNNDGGGSYGIELRPPDAGEVRGVVTIITSGVPTYPTDMVRATDPTMTERTATPSAGGAFTFTDAVPGLWHVAFDTPPNHRLDTPATGEVSGVVQPGTNPPTSGFDATFTELATVDVRLFDGITDLPISPSAGLELTGFATATRPAAPPDADGVYQLSGVPVAAIQAATTPVSYALELDLADYDLGNAEIDGLPVDARNIALSVVAGERVTLDIYVEPFGSLEGRIVGQTQTGDELLSLDTTPPALAATLQAIRVDADGNPITTDDEPATVEAGATPGTFRVIGPAGLYRLVPAHPQYADTPVVIPPNPTDPLLPAGVFQMVNGVNPDLGDFRLALRQGSLSIEAVATLASGVDVEGAVYDLYPGTASTCTGTPSGPRHGEIPLGGVTLTDVVPGTYCLAINKFDPDAPTERLAFTAIVMVDIPRETADAPSETTVVAPLPLLRPTLVGTLHAENTKTPTPDRVPLVAPGGITVTSEFTTSVDIDVNGSTEDNLNPDDGGRTAAASPTPPVPPATTGDGSWTYVLEAVPYGLHDITAPTIAGYTLSNETQSVNVTSEFGPTQVPAFVYVVDQAPVEIDLGDGVFPSLDSDFVNDTPATVTLTSPSGTTYTTYELDDADPATPNRLVLASVPYEAGTFRIVFDDALHAAVDQTFSLGQALNARGRRAATITQPTADRVRLTGTVRQRTGPAVTNVTNLQVGGRILLDGDTDHELAPSPGTSSAGTWLVGAYYAIDVPAGTYALSVTQTGYATENDPALSLVAVGQLVSLNLEVERLASVTVNAATNGLAAPAGLDLQLVNVDTNDVLDPTTEPNSFQIPAGRYYARAKATGYPDQRSVGNTTLTIGAGATTPVGISVVLPRYVRVTVVGPSNATVTVDGKVKTAATSSAFEFTDVEAVATRIPSTGALTGTIGATGYRPQEINVPASINHAQTVTLAPLVDVSGSIPGAVAGSITASNGTTSVTGTITGSGSTATYAFEDLGIGTWTVTYDRAGSGHTPTPVTIATITATSPAGNSLTGASVPLTVRNVDYTTIVRVPDASAQSGTARFPGASVVILDSATPTPNVLASGATLADDPETPGNERGTIGFSVPETATPTRWRVSHVDYMTRTAAISTNPIVLIPAITGAVTDAGEPVVGATVRVCPATPANAPCAASAALATTASIAAGVFKFTDEIAPGSYRVWAISGTATGSVTLNVTANAATLGAATIPIAAPGQGGGGGD